MYRFPFQKAHPTKLKYALWLFFIFFSQFIVAQNNSFFIKRRGVPQIKNYSAKDYHDDPFNHDVVQDNRGVLYFANNSEFFVILHHNFFKSSTKSQMLEY